jgi:protein SCO1
MTYVNHRALLLAFACLLPGCASLQAAHFSGTPILPVRSAPNFTLTDDRGKPWTLADQHHTIALFFGYTRCADTCPMTISKLARAIHDSGVADAQIAFVTVDPERDAPAVLARYDRQFGGEHTIVGLTGTQTQITSVEHAYQVWAQRIPGKRGADKYDDSHSAIVFYIDDHGNERIFHDPTDRVADLAADFRALQ